MRYTVETPSKSQTKSEIQYITPDRSHIKDTKAAVYSPYTANIPIKRCCNCEKSRCIKLYCDCYANGVYCDGCNCIDCLNNGSHEQSRKVAIQSTLERNPTAFQPKISSNELEMKFSPHNTVE